MKFPPWWGYGYFLELHIWVNLKNVSPPFLKFMSVYIKMSFTQVENHSQLLHVSGLDFANERLLLCQFDV